MTPTDLIRRTTTLASAALVPELRFHLADDSHDIWQTVDEAATNDLARRPYWAFLWPGGQALARVLIDQPEWVAGKRVLDIGCGSGVGAIAAMRAGAASALANDIDPLAVAAASLNAAANGLAIGLSADDMLGSLPDDADVVLMADVVYEPELAVRVQGFVETARRRGVPILFADRGTTRLPIRPLDKLAEFTADVVPAMTHPLFERGIVWRLA